MIKKIAVPVMAVVAVGLCVEFIYANLKLKFEAASSRDLNTRLMKLQSETTELSSALSKKEAELKALSDVRAIRLALTNAQNTVAQMSTQLAQVSGDRMALQQSNISLSARLDNTTKELMRSMDELKRARSVQLGAGASGENKIKELETERDTLRKQLTDIASSAGHSGESMKSLQDSIAGLTNELAQKKEQVQVLESRLKQAPGALDTGRLKERERTILELQEENRGLNADIARLRSLRTNSAQDAADAQAQVEMLQERLAGLSRNKADDSDVQGLRQELADTQEALEVKTAQAQALQKNLDAAKQKLAQREQEQRAIEAKITQLESMTVSLQDELKKRRSFLDENDAAYVTMRQQITQLSSVLAKREIELDGKAKEMAALNEQSYSLKLRIVQLEEELNGARERQRRTMDDLYQAVKLNAAMQERMLGASQSLGGAAPSVADQQKADLLKRKIEVILEPDRSP